MGVKSWNNVLENNFSKSCHRSGVASFSPTVSVQRPKPKAVLTDCVWQPTLQPMLDWRINCCSSSYFGESLTFIKQFKIYSIVTVTQKLQCLYLKARSELSPLTQCYASNDLQANGKKRFYMMDGAGHNSPRSCQIIQISQSPEKL